MTAKALGLLAHVLRDLDESDIALGYGAAKGYGRSSSASWKALGTHGKRLNQAMTSINDVLVAFATAPSNPLAATAQLITAGVLPPADITPTAMTGDFHNPYVFLPFGAPNRDDLHWDEYNSLATKHHSHARYARHAFHGRMVCRLTTQTPIFIGAGDVPDTCNPKQKQNFKLKDQIALPATSLRGMLSSLHESITRSRMRVVEDGQYVKWIDNDACSLSVNASPDTQLSPSELLFGCGQIKDKKKEKSSADQAAIAYSGKVHIGYGRSLQPIQPLAEVTLKILASPKPPSPAMYFQPVKEPARYISKEQLVQSPSTYQLKGRKVYLHSSIMNGVVQKIDANGHLSNNGSEPWKSIPPQNNATQQQRFNYERANKQRVRVKPIPQGKEFFFEVDFANLTQKELESLCASLTPDKRYEHKLGMGKPIGLGSVKIDIIGMYLVDRVARYRQTDFKAAARYNSVWKVPELFPQNLPGHLKCEEIVKSTSNSPSPDLLALAQMTELSQNAQAVFKAIVLSGNPDAVKKPVHYPQLAGQNIEAMNYKWFTDNDGTGNNYNPQHKWLDSFTATSTGLPALTRIRRKMQP